MIFPSAARKAERCFKERARNPARVSVGMTGGVHATCCGAADGLNFPTGVWGLGAGLFSEEVNPPRLNALDRPDVWDVFIWYI